jgi:hypothetical protein
MKVDVFKKLIKEAVREVLREELSQTQSSQIQENKAVSFTSQDVDMVAYRQNLAKSIGLIPPNQSLQYTPTLPKSTGNPYLDIIAETAATTSPMELAQMGRHYD